MQPSEVCRVCGGTGLFLNIFDEKTKYSEDLEDCLSVKVNPDDGNSQVICHKCLGTLSWCRAYVSKVDLLKKNNPSSSTKMCYSCRSAKGHLFPFPDKSVEKFQEFFGLSLMKSKNLKICHECQFSLDCVSDLREKANTSQKLSRRTQHLQFEVTQKNASVDDLVCSLKHREVEVDGSSRKSSRVLKSPQTVKGENGTTMANSDEEDNVKKKSSSGKHVDSKQKKSSRGVKSNVRDSSSSENGKERKQKRKRRVSTSGESELNTSTDSHVTPKSKRLFASEDSPYESRRSSHESNNSKQDEVPKKQSNSKEPKETGKRRKLNKSKKQDVDSDPDDDSQCLATFIDTNAKGKQATESSKKLAKNKTKASEFNEDVSISRKNRGNKSERSRRSSSDDDKQQALDSCKKRPDSRRVHFEDTPKKNKPADHATKNRRKKNAVDDSWCEEEPEEPIEVKRKKNPPLQEYTCTVCLKDFSSTVEGKTHELSHDFMFDKFEVKLVRMSASEIASAIEKSTSVKNDLDDDDDLWTPSTLPKVAETENKPTEDAFDALVGAEVERKSTTVQDSAEKTEDTPVDKTSDSEERNSEPAMEVDESDQNSEEKKLDELPGTENADEISTASVTKDAEVSEKEVLDSQGGEEKSEQDSSHVDKSEHESSDKSDTQDAESRNGDLKENDKIAEESNEGKPESEETENLPEEETPAAVESEVKNESNGQDDSGTVASSQVVDPADEEPLENDLIPSLKDETVNVPESETKNPDSNMKESENSVSNNAEGKAENSDVNSSIQD